MNKSRLISYAVTGAFLLLFIFLIREIDADKALARLADIGLGGMLVVLALHGAAIGVDVAAWQLTFVKLRPRAAWFARLWMVSSVGEAVSMLGPFGALGGEPVKAYLLNSRYGVTYRDSAATLLLQQTLIALAQAIFIGFGVIWLHGAGLVAPSVEHAIRAAAIVLGLFITVTLVAVARGGLIRPLDWLHESRFGTKILGLIAAGRDIEVRIVTFLTTQPKTFVTNIALNFLAWLCGALEIWLMLWLLGSPIDFTQAWVIETCVVLVRSVTFFVPGHLGAQDGAITFLVAAITGAPDLGLAIALLRRLRELFWAAVGLIIGTTLGWRPRSDTPA